MTKKADSYGEREAARRRDEIVRRMIATPPKPFTPPARPKRRVKKTKKS
jgi:hypothetical protein